MAFQFGKPFAHRRFFGNQAENGGVKLFLGLKVTEEGRFVDSSGVSNFPGGRRVEPFLGKELDGSLEDLNPAIGTGQAPGNTLR
jgi:hypothetical protein